MGYLDIGPHPVARVLQAGRMTSPNVLSVGMSAAVGAAQGALDAIPQAASAAHDVGPTVALGLIGVYAWRKLRGRNAPARASPGRKRKR